MRSRSALLFAMAFGCVASVAPRAAAQLELVVDSASGSVGELFLKNTGVTGAVVDAYSFSSDDAFLVNSRVSITGNFDSLGDGSVDSDAPWFLLGPQSASTIAEASSVAGSGLLDPGQVVSFGAVFDLTRPLTLTGLIVQGETTGADPQPIFTNLVGEFRDLTADYNGDLNIDELDYGIFIESFGSNSDLRADGNGDGVINASDYTVWRDAFDLQAGALATVALSPISVLAVPEPTTLALAFMAAVAAPRRRRAAS